MKVVVNLLVIAIIIVLFLYVQGCGKDAPDGMVLIPAGEFEMGSENDGDLSEPPVHTVYVDAFYIDKYEVTVGEYKQFIKETGHRALPDWVYKHSPTDQHPVVGVSWHDAMAYATWAGKRLPTEAEWEKAARGGSTGKKYTWGNTPPNGTQANMDGKADGYEYTAPVGSFPPNTYGLYDMAGNVWEWCLDEFQGDFYERSPRNNPIAGESIKDIVTNSIKVKSVRVLRSGYWNNITNDTVDVATRYSTAPTNTTSYNYGFRCVKPVNH